MPRRIAIVRPLGSRLTIVHPARRARRVCAVLVALVTLAACGTESRLAVSAQPMTPALDAAKVRYRIESGVFSASPTLAPAAPGSTQRRTAEALDTPHDGTARVSFVIVLGDGREAARGETTVTLRQDWQWDFDLFQTTTDPTATCFGCAGARAFPLRADLRVAGRDSIWLVWGGNSIDHPVVY